MEDAKGSPYTVWDAVAADDVDPKSTILKVISPTFTPFSVSGTLDAGITKSTVELTDKDGNSVSANVSTANHIVATWGGKSGHAEPPLIAKGEPVELYRYNGQDKFYWRETGLGSAYRKTDRVSLRLAATDPTKPAQERTDDNSWRLYANTDSKIFGIETSKVNGEVCRMAIKGDMSKGTLYITDDSDNDGNKNCLVFDTGAVSGTPSVHIGLTTGVTFRMEGKNLMIEVPETMIVKTGKSLIFNSPLTMFNTSTTGVFIVNALNASIKTAGSFVVTAGSVIGLNSIATKVAGVLVAGATRLASLARGGAGSSYTGVSSSDPVNGTVTNPTNSADTDTSVIVTNLPV